MTASFVRVVTVVNTVEPIRDMNTVLDIADYLKLKNIRDYVLFMFGIYSGLRISDILEFRVRDVKDKNVIIMREKKTRKEKTFKVNKVLKKILDDYTYGMKDYEYLFKSPKGKNNHITRQQAYNILREAAGNFDVEAVGTHTLRKTFGYHTYQQTKDVAGLMDIFNHSSQDITLRYIGINQDNKDRIMSQLKFER